MAGAHAIPGGLIYIGRRLPSTCGGVEPALVNPDLPVAAPGAAAVAPAAGPALAYHLLAPATRTAYLTWLAGGRIADVSPALVLLFCGGLERRVLVDGDHDPAVRGELPAITAEVRRLRVRYDDGGPTLRAALDHLLDLLELLSAERDTPGARGMEHDPNAMSVRIALARFAVTAAPVPADWARAWARHHAALAPRSAELACPAEFDRLFPLRYTDRYGRGLVPTADLPGIRLRYRPANPGLATTLVCREDLPDVLADARSTRALGALLDDVAAALGPYRRWLAKFPHGRGSLAAATLLPAELVDADRGRLGALRVWCERQLDGRPWTVVDAVEFWAFWATSAPERMARDEATALITVLSLLNLGVEPDVRFGAPALAPGPAVLFRLGRPVSDHPGDRFRGAAAIVRCAAAVASAAGPVDPRDGAGTAVLRTAGDLAAMLHLDPGEDLRLAARLGWLLTTGVDVDRLGRHTASLSAAEREVAGHYLVTVAAAADPAVGPATVAVLIRVYRFLGVDAELVFQRVHERSVGGGPVPPKITRSRERAEPGPPAGDPDGPVVVQVAGDRPNGYALPWAVRAPGEVVLDRAAVNRKIAESRAAATLLTEVFELEPEPVFEPEPEPEPVAGPAPAVGRIAGLDPAHSALLRTLATRPSWSREEFASLAATHGVLPDGAFDLLNEVAIEAVGAPVIEDAATLAVDEGVFLELLT